MKMLKKLAALILAATMVLVLFTACGGDTTPTPEAQAEAQMMSTINANRPEGKKLENNAQCRAIASQHIDEVANGDLNFSLNLFGYSSKVWFKIDGPKDGKCAATFVTTFDYDGTKLNKFVQKIAERRQSWKREYRTEHEMDTGWRCCQSCEWSDLHGYLGGY